MLCPNAIGSRSEIVQAGFAHDADAVVPRKFLNSGVCRTQLAPRGESGCLVGVQRHSGDDRGIPMGDDDGGLGTLQIAPDVDDPVDADGGRSGKRGRSRATPSSRTMSRWAWLSTTGCGSGSGAGGGPCPAEEAAINQPSSRASSSAITDSSSLTKTGTGLPIGVPGVTATRRHGGVAE